MSPFHHPTPGFEAGDGLGLFTSAKDGGVPPWGVQGRLRRTGSSDWSFGWGRKDGLEIGLFGSGSGLGAGRGTGRLSTVARTSFVAVGPGHRQPHRNALGLTAFDAGLTPVRGVGTSFPPRGDLVMAPSMLSQLQSRPFNSANRSSPSCHSRRNTPARSIPESADRPWSRSKYPWQPLPSTGCRWVADIPLAQVRSGTRGWPPPKGWLFTRWGSSGADTSHRASDT